MSSTDSTDRDLRECAVCAAKTATRCSGCLEEGLFLCSREHQKLLWSTHKWLCGKDPSTFVFPPLDGPEIEALKEVIDAPYRKTRLWAHGESFMEALRNLRLWNGTREGLIAELSSSTPSIPEPQRSWLLARARQHPAQELVPGGITLWCRTGMTSTRFFHLSPDEDLISPDDFFTTLNPYLRQAMICTGILYLPCSPTLTKERNRELLRLTHARLGAIAEDLKPLVHPALFSLLSSMATFDLGLLEQLTRAAFEAGQSRNCAGG